MEAFKSLEKLNNDSKLMNLLEEQELEEYCQRTAMVEQKQIGFEEGKNTREKTNKLRLLKRCYQKVLKLDSFLNVQI